MQITAQWKWQHETFRKMTKMQCFLDMHEYSANGIHIHHQWNAIFEMQFISRSNGLECMCAALKSRLLIGIILENWDVWHRDCAAFDENLSIDIASGSSCRHCMHYSVNGIEPRRMWGRASACNFIRKIIGYVHACCAFELLALVVNDFQMRSFSICIGNLEMPKDPKSIEQVQCSHCSFA